MICVDLSDCVEENALREQRLNQGFAQLRPATSMRPTDEFAERACDLGVCLDEGNVQKPTFLTHLCRVLKESRHGSGGYDSNAAHQSFHKSGIHGRHPTR